MKEMQMQKIKNLSEQDYRELPYISVTQVCRRAVAKSAWEYHNTTFEETSSMLLGSLFDAMVTGVGVERFQRSEAATKSSKAFKEQEETAKAEGIKLVTSNEWEKAEAMARSFKSHPTVQEIFRSCEFQVSYVSEQDNLKGRLDALQNDMFDATVWDIKTCSNNFVYAVKDYGYDMQLAAYMRMAGATQGGWLVIDTSPPHEITIYKIKTSTLMKSLEQFDQFFHILKQELVDEGIKNRRNTEIQYI